MSDAMVVTPVLSSNIEMLTDVRDQITNFLRFVILNPGWTSSLWEDQLVSFRKISSAYEQNKDVLANKFTSAVRSELVKSFPSFNFDVITTTTYDNTTENAGGYYLTFEVSFFDVSTDVKEPMFISGKITISSSNEISLDFTNSLFNT